jgi:hypothetical protein
MFYQDDPKNALQLNGKFGLAKNIKKLVQGD